MSSKRELRSGGTTSTQTLDATKVYKLNSSGALVEATTVAGTDIVFTGSKSALRRLNDLERNVSILAARTQTDDGGGSGNAGSVDYATKSAQWNTARTITLSGDLTGSVSINGTSDVTLSATVAANSIALGTDTTGNYMVNVSAGTGISVSHTQGEGSTATVSLNATTDNVSEGTTNLYHTTARARGAVSAGTGISYNSTTGVISTSAIPNASLSNSSVTVGTTAISLGASSTTLAGLTSVTSTGFTGALTGNASTATALATARTINGISFDGSANVTVHTAGTGISISGTTVTNAGVTSNVAGTGISVNASTGAVTITNTGVLSVSGTSNQITASTSSGAVTLSLPNNLITPGDLTVSGNLTVSGTTTTVNATTVSVADINIELGKTASPTNATADGGGITLKGTTDKTLNWVNSTGAWTSSEHIATAAGKSHIFNGGTSGSITVTPTAVAGTNTLTLPAVTGTFVTTGDTGTVTNAMLAGSIANAKLTNSSVTVGTTAISLGSSSTTLAGLTSVTSTGFTGALTGNASTATTLQTARTISGVSFDGSANITLTTSNIGEGSNLYYTDARARAAISGSTGISYNSTTGAISSTITQYSDALARGAVSFTAGSGAYNSTTGVFTIPTNTNQLTNGAGFITGYTETDTLASVTGRGATTGTAVSFTNATASTSKITGAVVVTGGVGISGALYVGGEVTAYASDAALKTNVVAIDNALSKVEAIRGVSYDWNEAGQALGLGTAKQIGVIAQEIEAVAPELVVQSAHEGYKTVKYDKLTALLIEAVKDLSAKVKTLEAQLGKSL